MTLRAYEPLPLKGDFGEQERVWFSLVSFVLIVKNIRFRYVCEGTTRVKTPNTSSPPGRLPLGCLSSHTVTSPLGLGTPGVWGGVCVLFCLWKFYPQLSPQLKQGGPLPGHTRPWRRQHCRVRLCACRLASALPCGRRGLRRAAGGLD